MPIQIKLSFQTVLSILSTDYYFASCVLLDVCLFIQNVTKLNAVSTNVEGAQELQVLAKRKAHDEQSEIKKKCFKGNIAFVSRKCVTN